MNVDKMIASAMERAVAKMCGRVVWGDTAPTFGIEGGEGSGSLKVIHHVSGGQVFLEGAWVKKFPTTGSTWTMFKKEPVVQCQMIIVPKDEQVAEGATMTERWENMQMDCKEVVTKRWGISTQDWIGVMMRKDWTGFEKILTKYILPSKPHEWDSWVGGQWRNLHGKARRPEGKVASGGKVAGAGVDGTPTPTSVEVEVLERLAATNCRKLASKSGYKKSARYWNARAKSEMGRELAAMGRAFAAMEDS